MSPVDKRNLLKISESTLKIDNHLQAFVSIRVKTIISLSPEFY